MKLLLLIGLVLVAVGWVYHTDLPFIGHSQVGSAKGAEAWLKSTGNLDMAGGTVLNGTPILVASCENSHRPTGSIMNPELSQQGISSSWYQCIAYPQGKSGEYMCVAGLGGGPFGSGVTYTLVPGKCHAPRPTIVGAG